MTPETPLARWQRLLVSRRDQMEAAYARLGRDNADFWERNLQRFRRSAGIAEDSDPVIQRVLALLPEGGSVLDVGAGYGRLTLPLARHAAHIVAVEPQDVMARLLREGAAEAGIGNVTLIQSGWMEVETRVEPADVVLCSGVLFAQPGQDDIAAWLRTLDTHAHTAVVVSQPATWGEPPLLAELWQRFHGEPRIPTSTSIDVYDVLWELGIAANVEVSTLRRQSRFESVDQAVAIVREQLILADTATVTDTLRAALQLHLRATSGGWELPAQPAITATIWWERNGQRRPGALS